MDVYEEIAKAVPGISVENAGQMLASEEGVTAKEVQEFYKGKQSIVTTARSQGKRHGKSGKEIQGPYGKMEDYKNSYLVGKGEYDGSRLVRFDPRYEYEELYQNSFNKAKAKSERGRQTEDREAGMNFDRAARNEDRGEGFTMKKISKDLFRDPKK